MNKVGDVLLLVGIASFGISCGSLDFYAINTADSGVITDTYYTIGCMMLFAGAVAKSAQLGLHTWLPDAMEGPSPVSALIHAATMVTAGVFLLIRFSFIYEERFTIYNLITMWAITTAFFASCTAVSQNDLKRLLPFQLVVNLAIWLLS